jgi:SAM-dependent methyltransferase
MGESARKTDTKMNAPPVSLSRDLVPSPAPLAQVASSRMLTRNIYTDGTYLDKNPLWHTDESPFKVKQILRMLKKHRLQPTTICEVGCGAGEVLRLLQQKMDDPCHFWGYDISPQAMKLCKNRTNDGLHFKLADLTREEGAFFDLLLVLDVFEHVEDYFGFLDGIRAKGDLKIFHIPLDLSVQAVLRKRGLLKRRELWGHLHYFTKETALETLKHVGYEVLDYFYTPRSIELATEAVHKLALLPRMICFRIHQDLAVRTLGGYGLLVLAR